MFPELFNDPDLFCYFLFFFFVSHVVNQNRGGNSHFTLSLEQHVNGCNHQMKFLN